MPPSPAYRAPINPRAAEPRRALRAAARTEPSRPTRVWAVVSHAWSPGPESLFAGSSQEPWSQTDPTAGKRGLSCPAPGSSRGGPLPSVGQLPRMGSSQTLPSERGEGGPKVKSQGQTRQSPLGTELGQPQVKTPQPGSLPPCSSDKPHSDPCCRVPPPAFSKCQTSPRLQPVQTGPGQESGAPGSLGGSATVTPCLAPPPKEVLPHPTPTVGGRGMHVPGYSASEQGGRRERWW